MIIESIKVFVIENKVIYKKILKDHEYTVDDNGKIAFNTPPNSKLSVYSLGFGERMYGITWENYPVYPNDISKNKEP